MAGPGESAGRGDLPRGKGTTAGHADPIGRRAPPPLYIGRSRLRNGFTVAALAAPIVVLAFGPRATDVSGYLPAAAYDLLLSFGRMLTAYLLSLAFALVYGYFAAFHRMGERVLIPILDILQSIPILGFFPFAIVFFVKISGGSWIGPNFASVFLIFTSMAWNMVFGVYESLKSLPPDLKEAADSFTLRGWQRMKNVILPATVNRLVYNSILSWTAGWYFLVAAEFISTSAASGAQPVALRGIGTFLLTAAGANNGAALIAGLVLLIALIAALDVLVWRPLGRWAENYRYDTTPSGDAEEVVTGSGRPAPLRRAAGFVYRGVVSGVSRLRAPLVNLAISAAPIRLRQSPAVGRVARTVTVGLLLVLAWLLLIFILVGAYSVFTGPIDSWARDHIVTIPLALAASGGRLVFAYGISLAIALPLAIYLVGRPRVYKVGLPVVEIVASVPATALFPLFIFGLLSYIGFQGAAIVMLTTGMLWYLFFNILSGLRAIPPDLKEAGRSLGLGRWQYYRRLVLPAIFPALITGSITAFGGGWNTLIIAEYLRYSSTQSFQVLGIGELIDLGNNTKDGFPLMAAALVTMVVTVVAVNELLWKPLYRQAVEKYRYD